MELIHVSKPTHGEVAYRISLHNYDNTWFLVGAYNEQEALDKVVDYCKEKGYAGYYFTLSEIEEEGYSEDDFVSAGNEGLYVDREHLQIVEVSTLEKEESHNG